MLKDLYKDSDGKTCAAKVAFMSTVATCLSSILYATYAETSIDYNGMGVLIAAVGAIYFGRSQTKASNKNV